MFDAPIARETKLICASRSPVVVCLDGEQIIASQAHSHDMPAYHRAHKDQCALLELPAGRHTVTVTAIDLDAVPEFRFFAVRGRIGLIAVLLQ